MLNSPLYFQAVLLTTATDSGLRLVILSLTTSVTGTITGFAITRTRRLLWPLITGVLLNFMGTVSIAMMCRGWPTVAYLLCLAPSGIGQGFYYPGSFMAILAASEQHEQAVVTSTLLLSRSIGMVLGISSSSLVVQNALVYYLERFVTGEDKADVITRVRNSVGSISGLSPEHREQAVLSYEAALKLTYLCCVILAAISVFITLPIKLPRLGQRK